MVRRMETDIKQRIPRGEDGGIFYIGEGVKFERIRRITGYLVGTVDRFNNAKQAELRDRVKHTDMRRP